MQRSFLITAAFAAEAGAAWLALPAAQHKLGMMEGSAFAALVAAAIFFIWKANFFTAGSFWQRMAYTAIASLFVFLSVVSGHYGANLPEQLRIEKERESAQQKIDADHAEAIIERNRKVADLDAAWGRQEQARLNSLSQIDAEIKATKKKEQPEIYAALLERQKELSTRASQPSYPTMPVKEELPKLPEKPFFSDLTFLQSLVFSIMTPVFLWLASITPERKKKGWSVRGLIAGLYAFLPPYSVQTSEISQSEPAKEKPVFVDPFAEKLIKEDPQYGVTLPAIIDFTGESERQARKLRNAAVSAGNLHKHGNKYSYTPAKKTKPKQTRASVSYLRSVN